MNFIKCFALLTVFYFASCSPKTQLFETKSSLPVHKNQYVFDNDTLRIEYNFWANKGLLSYRIINKLDVPVYIDWKKSSFIRNGYKMDYWSDIATTNTSGASYSFYRNVWFSESTSNTFKPERVLFLAPKSFITVERFTICGRSTPLPTGSATATIPVPEHPRKAVKVKSLEYAPSGSPLTFRNFLTYSLTEQLSSENYVDNSFYVSEVIEMKRMDFFNGSIQTKLGTQLTTTFINPSFFYVDL